MRDKAVELLEKLREEQGISDKAILEYIIYNFLTGDDAHDALKHAEEEFEE